MGENADVAGTAGAAIEEVVRENARRHEARRQSAAREAVAREVEMPGESAHVRRERCRRDFLYWAETCARIKDKMSGRMVPFRLNAPQRRVAALLERERGLADPSA